VITERSVTVPGQRLLRVSVEELAHRKGVRAVASLDEMARDAFASISSSPSSTPTDRRACVARCGPSSWRVDVPCLGSYLRRREAARASDTSVVLKLRSISVRDVYSATRLAYDTVAVDYTLCWRATWPRASGTGRYSPCSPSTSEMARSWTWAAVRVG
jgi:hypothetical protein